VKDDEAYEKTDAGWEWTGTQADADPSSKAELATGQSLTQTNTEKVESEENIQQSNTENMEEEIQEDEPAENTESSSTEAMADEKVLGVEIAKENKTENHMGFFYTILWKTNQSINQFINLITDYF
jgi:hypothetical protein